jgi:hypothetical protein
MNYVDMDLTEKSKPTVTDKILYSAIGAVNGVRTKAMRVELEDNFNASIASSQTLKIIVIVCTALLVLPLFCLLKRRYQIHEQIYNLFVSIEAAEIEKEITKQVHFAKVIGNYSNSKEAIKSNILGINIRAPQSLSRQNI